MEINMTDWYFGHDSGDQCFDRLPSPDTWLQWETCGIGGNSGWANTFDSGYLLSKNPQQRAVASSASNKGTSQADGAHDCSEFGRSSADFQSLRNAIACARPDYYFNDLTRNDTTDDIFLGSLLQDDALPLQSLYIAVPSDSNSASIDFQSISCDTDALGDIHASKFSSRNHSDQSSCQSVKVPETRVMVPSDQENSRGTSDDDFSSNEESVLMRLESVLNQLNDETRLCLRDSLYRLAKHSEHQTSYNDLFEGLPPYESSLPETSGGCSRSTAMDSTESATNAIDRAVAYLMFSKVDASEQDHLPPLSPEYLHNDRHFAGTATSGFSDINTLGTSDQLVQCEVPVFSQQIQGSSHQLAIGSQNNAF